MHSTNTEQSTINDLLRQLSEKFASSGQDMASYLEGLLYEEYLSYWDYIHLDTLLSLQKPRTAIPDERIFIIYHQITELYFRLILLELEQISTLTRADEFAMRVARINRYFKNLVLSFDVMVDGMEQSQFLKFRMALLPASGFQSAQYRKIEIAATDFVNLVDKELRANYTRESSISDMFEFVYWKKGATELATGKKTLTLESFERKYSKELISFGEQMREQNLFALYSKLPEDESKEKLKIELRKLDSYVNVNWPLVHYKSAVRYLERDPESIAATGGTNWQKYLPPRFQKRIFYPTLWTESEKESWGKAWVDKEVIGLGN